MDTLIRVSESLGCKMGAKLWFQGLNWRLAEEEGNRTGET